VNLYALSHFLELVDDKGLNVWQRAFGLAEDKYGNYVVQVCQRYVLLELFPICVLTCIIWMNHTS
jgi:hypothetical protein